MRSYWRSRLPLIKTMLIVIGILLTLIFLVEGLVRVFLLGQPPYGHVLNDSRVIYQIHHLTRLPHKPLIAFMGDSTTRHDIYPERIQQQLQHRYHLNTQIINVGLGMPSSTLTQWFLKDMLARDIKPALIVLSVTYYTLHRPEIHPQNTLTSLGYHCETIHRSHQRYECLVNHYVYAWRFRYLIWDSLNGLPHYDFGSRPPVFSITLPIGQGWQPSEYMATPFKQGDSLKYLGKYAPFHYYPERLQAFLSLCQHHQIPVLVVWYPQSPWYDDVQRHVGVPTRDELAPMFQHIVQSYPNAYFMNWSKDDPNPTHFFDFTHLNVYGDLPLADRLSRTIGTHPELLHLPVVDPSSS